MVFNELHHHPCHLHKRVPHIPRSLSPIFKTIFALVFEVHTRDRTSRTGPGSRCSSRRRLKTTQQLWRANFTQFSPRASQLNLERRSVCKTQTSVGNVVVVTAFFLGENAAFYPQVFWGLVFMKVTKLSVEALA